MRGHDDIILGEQRVIQGRRLRILDIEPGPGDAAAFQRVNQVALIDDAAAGGIDDVRTRLALPQAVAIDEVPGLVVEGGSGY